MLSSIDLWPADELGHRQPAAPRTVMPNFNGQSDVLLVPIHLLTLQAQAALPAPERSSSQALGKEYPHVRSHLQ